MWATANFFHEEQKTKNQIIGEDGIRPYVMDVNVTIFVYFIQNNLPFALYDNMNEHPTVCVFTKETAFKRKAPAEYFSE